MPLHCQLTCILYSVVTRTVTSTAYVANGGETIAIAKRDAVPTGLVARAQATPAFFSDLSRADLRSACVCLNVARATVTRSMTTGVYATETKILQRKIIKTTTLAAPVVTQVLTNGMLLSTSLDEHDLTLFTSSLHKGRYCCCTRPNHFSCRVSRCSRYAILLHVQTDTADSCPAFRLPT